MSKEQGARKKAYRCVPAVYLAHAIRAIVAILAVRGMNNLRVCNEPVGSNPTRASNILVPNDLRSSAVYPIASGIEVRKSSSIGPFDPWTRANCCRCQRNFSDTPCICSPNKQDNELKQQLR